MKNGTQIEKDAPALPLFARFRTRLALLILLVFLPALLLTIHTNLHQRQTEKARIREGTIALAKLVAASEQNYVKNTRQLLATLTSISFLMTGTNRPMAEMHFINLCKLLPDYLDFGLIEADGTLFCSAVVTNGTPNLSKRSFFQRVINAKHFAIGDYQAERFTKERGLDFGYPIFDPQGRLSRVLYCSLNLAPLNQALAQIDLPAATTVTMVDESANIMARYPDSEKWLGKTLVEEPYVQQILHGSGKVFEMQGLDGIERLFAVAPISDGRKNRLFASVGIPGNVVFAGVNRDLVNSLIILVIVATLALLAGHLYATHSFLAPLHSLVMAARRLAAGQWSVRTDIDQNKGELSELGSAFDEMAATLEQRQRDLQAADAEIRRVNAELEQRVKGRTFQLEEANRELEAFSYSVSHDLRAPLRHTDGFAQLLRQDPRSQLSDDGKRYVQEVSNAVKRMGKLIDDLLHFSRMGRGEMRFTEWNMGELVEEVRRDISPAGDGRKIEWQTAKLPQVCADWSMLKQVWANLLNNAVKYTCKRDRAEIIIGFQERAEEFEFFVRDNGAGFDMQYAGKLFGVFQRLHGEDEFEGTGIGLANVRRIIHRHGGRTWAQAEVEAGATFYFTLPRIPGKECHGGSNDEAK